jgi:tetratricopeptide (TPR) repeat protein
MRLAVQVGGGFLALALAATAALAQSREYRVSGAVVDTDKRPIAGATVEMRERTSRTAFRVTSDERGAFRMVGMPHGIYDVKVAKPGYQTRTDEWSLSEPQDSLKRVEINPYVLMSEGQVADIARNTRLRSQLDEAMGLMHKGESAAALVVLEKMLAEQPDDANAHYLIGLCRLQTGELEAAAVSLGRATELSPDFAAAHTNLAICYEKLKDPARALASYEKALALDPDNPIALYNAGALRYNAGKAAEALPYFERMLKTKPDDDRALEMAGYCELQALHYAKALDHLERARPLITDSERAAALDEILKELRQQAKAPSGAGSDH